MQTLSFYLLLFTPPIDARRMPNLRRGLSPSKPAKARNHRPIASALTLCGSIAETVEPQNTIFTDLMHSYNTLSQNYAHQRVNHSKGHAFGDAHTNTIEGFWSLVKRGIQGVYYQVGLEYLQSYLNEYAFRYNRRKVMRPMFSLLAERTTMQVCPSAREQRLLARPE
jgi:hypothetical protein